MLLRFTHRWSLALAISCLVALTGCAPTQPSTPTASSTTGASTTGLSTAESSANDKSAASAPLAKHSDGPATPALQAAGAKVTRASNGQVTNVDLRGCKIEDAIIKEVASLTDLQQIDLRECSINNEQFTAMILPLTKLRAVRLSGKGGTTTIDDAGIAVLKSCPELRVLAVDEIWFSTDGLKHLAACQHLTELYAGQTLVDDDTMSLLAEFKDLKKLRLAKTTVSAKGLKALSSLKLEELDISECTSVDDAALEVVGQFTTLKRLNLWRDPVSDAGVSHLANLKNLTWYNLDNTQLTDAGLPHLAAMTELTFLHLGSTGVSDAGMPKLFGLKKLKDLKVTRTSVTEAGAKLVADQIPGVQVQVKYREETPATP